MSDSSSSSPARIESRKADHLDLCAKGDVAFRQKTNLLEAVDFIHDALPDLALDDVDLSVEFAGKRLAAPLVIAAMTGGVDRAEAINRDLASVAQELGIGFAFGSQRPLLTHGITAGYRVRDVAPDALVLGNIGVVQAGRTPPQRLAELVEDCGADALVVHLNPAMELVQPQGDDDFRGGLDTIAALVAALPVPVIVKETGCGLSRSVGMRIASVGVKWVDTSGAGGTSWVGVETQRAAQRRALLGETFWDWGIPTAASIAQLSGLGLGICATGGLRNGLDVARALALGAICGGIARPFLQAHAAGGRDGVRALAQTVIDQLRITCLLTACRRPDELARRPLVIADALARWVPAGSPLADRLLRSLANRPDAG
ncbi:MAG: type 2 isopentenyl-diphosphate Delta-isomerase [Oligoflexia bacterium]|nr:type 2 isopentenyl-diphosphate Delta-isomerase [Oligoflexia bacterium]